MSPPVIHRDFTLERTYPHAAAKVWRAFEDPVRRRRWFAEAEGFETHSYSLDFRVGGFERSRFRVVDGPEMTLDSVFLELLPLERMVYGYAMTLAGNPLSSSLGTIELFAGPEGTTRLVLHEHVACTNGKDQLHSRRTGTEGLLGRLAGELDAHD